MRNIRVAIAYIILAVTLLAFTSCGGSGGSSAGNGGQPINVSGHWDGTWESSSYGINGTFSVDVIQTDATLSGTISVPDIGMYDTELKGSVQGSTMVFGDINDEITFTGKVNGDSSSGSYSYPSLNNTGTWQGKKNSTEPAADLSGIWDVNYVWICEGESDLFFRKATITQSGNDLSIVYIEKGWDQQNWGLKYSGSGAIFSTVIAWNATEIDGDGTKKVGFTGTVSSDGNSIDGHDSANIPGSVEPCWFVYANKISSGTPEAWNGTWTSNIVDSGVISEPFMIIYSLNGTVMEGQMDGHFVFPFSLYPNLKGSITGNDIVFSDTDDQITFTGAINGNTASGIYTSTIAYPSPSENDTGTWEATRIVP